MSALVSAGDRIGVEAITYPVVKGIAAGLGITLVPLALDERGLTPEAIVQAHEATPLRGTYLQPTLHIGCALIVGSLVAAELAHRLVRYIVTK